MAKAASANKSRELVGWVKQTFGAGKRAATGSARRLGTLSSRWPKGRPIRTVRGTGRIGLELANGIMSLAVVAGFAASNISSRPAINLSYLEPYAEQYFTNAFNGNTAVLEGFSARIIPKTGLTEIGATSVSITGKDGEPYSMGEVRAQIAARPSIFRSPQIVSLYADNFDFTVKRTKDRTMRAGFGTPDTFSESSFEISPPGALPTGNPPQPPGPASLQLVEIKNSRIHLIDADSQFRLPLHAVTSRFTRSAGGKFDGNFSGKGQSLGQNTAPTLAFTINGAKGVETQARLELAGFSSQALSNTRIPYFNQLSAPINIRVDVAAKQRAIETLSVNADLGEGVFANDVDDILVNSARLAASYDQKEDTATIEKLTLDTGKARADFSGKIGNVFNFMNSLPLLFNLKSQNIWAEIGDNFDGPLDVKNLSARGKLDLSQNRIEFQNISAALDGYALRASGTLAAGKDLPIGEINMNAQIDGQLGAKQILHYWPKSFADGARRWVIRSVKKGTISDIKFQSNIDETDLKRGEIANDHLNTRFTVNDADIAYISTMPWLRSGQGYGTLQGNRMDIYLTEGMLGEAVIEGGRVEMPRLQPKGHDFHIHVSGRASAQSVLEIVDHKPFEVAQKYGLTPSEIKGSGEIKLSVTRPLREVFPSSRVKYSFDGQFSDVAIPTGAGPYTINDGTVRVHADKEEISINGDIKLGQWPAVLAWKKPLSFDGRPTKPANYILRGSVGRDDLDSFGIGLRRHLGGTIGVSVSGSGDGLAVNAAQIAADFNDTELNIGSLWNKAPGVPATFTGDFVSSDDAISMSNARVAAPGLSVIGDVKLSKDFRLEQLNLPVAKIDGVIDGAVNASPTDKGVLGVKMSGEYLNIEPWVSQAFQSQSSVLEAPIELSAQLQTLSLDPLFVLKNASASFTHTGTSVSKAHLSGQTEGGEFLAEISEEQSEKPAKQKPRRVRVKLPDAQRATQAFLGLTNIKNGSLEIDGTLPPTGQRGALSGSVLVSDFVLARAPAFAQIFSLASLQGLGDTLSGSGLMIEETAFQFSLDDGILKIRDGRANGPALGLTAAGDIDLQSRIMDFDGVLVPSYTVNSLLADVPVVGPLVVGKKGEGIFALNYTVAGPFDKAQVAVNPLSALTPGFLRRIFDRRRDVPDDPDVIQLIEQQKQPKK